MFTPDKLLLPGVNILHDGGDEFPSAGELGNTGRNAYRGPGYHSLDIGVRKVFATGRHVKVELRLDSFNALNSVNFSQPVNGRNSGNFGKILAAGDPRIMQVAIRLAF